MDGRMQLKEKAMQLKEKAKQLKVEAMQQKVDMQMIKGELHIKFHFFSYTHALSRYYIVFLFLRGSPILSKPYLSSKP